MFDESIAFGLLDIIVILPTRTGNKIQQCYRIVFFLTSSSEAHVPALPWHDSVVLLSPAPFWYLLSSWNVAPAENNNSKIVTQKTSY